MTPHSIALRLLPLVFTFACDRVPEPTRSETPAPEPAAPAAPEPATPAAPATSAAPHAVPSPDAKSDVVWQTPPGLEAQPSRSPMRLATFRIAKAAGDTEDGELTVFHFGANSGGTVESNIERWIGQFSDVAKSDVKRSERTVNGLVQHRVEIADGTFSSGMPRGPRAPKPNFAMIAAVVESKVGLYFFKATGPKATIQKARGDVEAFLDSIKMREP